MPNREKIAVGEFYHIYNRGVDKRNVVSDSEDADRFVRSLEFFNSKEPVLSLREVEIETKGCAKHDDPLVKIICYCLNPNHFHLLMEEIIEGGISELMKRIGGGYTWYFNNKNNRSGSLFQGVFKSVRVESNEQLLHLSAYINLNNKVHKISGETAGNVRSSWNEYMGNSNKNICNKEIILAQFGSIKEYKDFVLSSLREIINAKKDRKGLEILIGKHFF